MTIQLSGHSDEEQQKINTLVARILADGIPLVGTLVIPQVSYNSNACTYVLSIQYQREFYIKCITPIQAYSDYEYIVPAMWEQLMYSLLENRNA